MADPLPQQVIEKFSAYVQQIEQLDPWDELLLFRGQSVQGSLLPTVARSKPKYDTTENEKLAIQQFGMFGASLLPASGTSQLDLLVLAQHFGLATRLLDWTLNPLAALWFACSSRSEGDVYVYLLKADTLVEADVYSKDPFSPSRTRVIQPRYNNPRIIAQDGWFTLHRFSKAAKQFVALERNPDTHKHLTEFKIPANRRFMMLHSLERHGVTSRTLFPDLGGLCVYLNKKHWGA